MKIIGIGPSMVSTGWGVISVSGNRMMHLGHGTILPSMGLPLNRRLLFIYEGILDVLEEFAPEEAAIEEPFIKNNNATLMFQLGQIRAAAMLASAYGELLVAEYAAKVVKDTLFETRGDKNYPVAFMVRQLLTAPVITSANAADALAVAITHANHVEDTRTKNR